MENVYYTGTCEFCKTEHKRPSRWCSESCRAKQYYRKNKDKIYASHRAWYKRNPKKFLEYNRKYASERREQMREWQKKHRQDPIFQIKDKARSKARKTIKIPEGQLCEECNVAPAIERHHEDYSKPLDIMFVCRQCNVNLGEGKLPEQI